MIYVILLLLSNVSLGSIGRSQTYVLMFVSGTFTEQGRAVDKTHFEILRVLVLSQPVGTLGTPARLLCSPELSRFNSYSFACPSSD